MKVARGLAGVLLGFGMFLAIVHMLSGNLVLTVTWTVAAAVLGGYITARIAGAHEFPTRRRSAADDRDELPLHAPGRSSRPGWYQITIAGCGPISALIGAAIRLLTKPRQKHACESENLRRRNRR